MIGTKVLVSAIGLTVLFAHVEADEKVTGSIRGEEGRELEEYGYVEEDYEGYEYYKGTKSKKSKKSGSKGDKGGRCEASKSKKSSKKDWYWYGPPKDDSKICKIFSFLDDHHHYHHGGGFGGGGRQLATQVPNGECFDVEEYCHLIDHLHPGFNDMVCPCPYEEITYPWMKEGGYKSYKTEMVCPPKRRYYGGRELSTVVHYNDINRYGKFCSKALGFPYRPVKGGYGAKANYYDDDDGDCYDGCKKYVEYCCCKFGDDKGHYYD